MYSSTSSSGTTSKKVINTPSDVVPESLQGLVDTYPHLCLLDGHQVVVRADIEEYKRQNITIVSGGGSGHEPFAAGFVGSGLLSAAVAGDVFASPKVDSILAAILTVCGEKGCLLLVLNYTGDRLNFGVAASLARSMGKRVEIVFVGDDCALVQDHSHAGRRGLAGMILVCKIAGALAAQKESTLEQVRHVAQETAQAVRTIGVALRPCIVPGAHSAAFSLPDDTVEMGLGIHGEPGVRQQKLDRADVLVAQMIETLVNDLNKTNNQNKNLVLLVNSLGATPPMELNIISRAAIFSLETKHHFAVEKVLCGLFVTSIEMAGFSLSILPTNGKMSELLELHTNAPAFPTVVNRIASSSKKKLSPPKFESSGEIEYETTHAAADPVVETVVSAICDRLISEADYLTQLDQVVGDGDMGTSLQKAAVEIRNSLSKIRSQSPANLIKSLSNILRATLGGTSGPLYTIFTLRVAETLQSFSKQSKRADKIEGDGRFSALQWAIALQEGARGLSELGGAKVGDRTMVDALIPAADSLVQNFQNRSSNDALSALQTAAEIARKSAENTKNLTARKGRSSYLGARAVGHADPGAIAVAIQFEAALDALRKN